MARADSRSATEAGFQQQVIELARLQGWKVAHFRGVRTQRLDGSIRFMTPVQADGAGFPDLVLCRERLLFRELKADKGRLSEAQQAWLDWLGMAGQDAAVWRPKDWDEIEKVLGR